MKNITVCYKNTDIINFRRRTEQKGYWHKETIGQPITFKKGNINIS